MTSTNDPYRDWDAAYVLGALSPADRREYERHLSGCADCAAALAEFSGLPGLLGRVPRDRALALLEADEEVAGGAAASPTALAALAVDDGPDATFLARVAARAASSRRRSRLVAGGIAVAAAAVAAGLAIVLPIAFGGAGATGTPAAEPTATSSTGSDGGSGGSGTGGSGTGGGLAVSTVALDAQPGVPVSATVSFVPEDWGTRIEMDCSWGSPSASSTPGPSATGEPTDPAATAPTPAKRWEYVMYVTDATGSEYSIGSWTSGPGETTHPSLATGLTIDEISSVDVRVATSGKVVLTGAP